MKKTIFTGAGVAIVTPMNPDLSINWELLGTLIDDQIAHGTDAIVIAGTTGEASTMTDEEHVQSIRFAVERTAGRVPVVAGAGSNHTDYALWLSREAKQAGGCAAACYALLQQNIPGGTCAPFYDVGRCDRSACDSLQCPKPDWREYTAENISGTV